VSACPLLLPSSPDSLIRNSRISFNCMNLAALLLSSSKFVTGFLQRLSANGPNLSAVTIWCRMTSGLRSRIYKANLPNLSMNTRRDSAFSCHILTRASDVRWWGLLVAHCVLKRLTKVSKQSTERVEAW